MHMPNLTGHRAVITGGSDGIGLGIATRFAAAGAEVHLPVRNQRKGKSAIDEILAQAPHAEVKLHALDLSSLDSVREFTENMRAINTPIHHLVNNAGVMTPPARQVTRDGFELQFGTNHLGHVALVAGLLPQLQMGRARVTSQISIAANQGAVNWLDPNWEDSYNGLSAYSHSKIALGLFGLELQRQSEHYGWGITSNLAHPGVAPTNLLAAREELGRDGDTIGRRLIGALSGRRLLFGTVETAGLPAVYASTSPKAQGGKLYGPQGPGHLGGLPAEQKMYSRLRSVDDAKRMWDLSQQLAEVRFPSE